MSPPPTLPRAGRILPALLALAACAPPSQVIQVAPGPAPGRPAFTLPIGSGALYGLAVIPCGRDVAVWQFGTGGGLLTRIPSPIVYGDLPPGFTLRAGPAPLTPGCYDVFADGAAGRFTVQPGGTIVPAAR